MNNYLKMNKVFNFICLIIICASFITCQISANLWTHEMLGSPKNLKFVNANEFLLASERAVISKINLNAEVQWKKNMIYKSEYDIDSAGLCNNI
jgi:hypothetical protein